MVPTGSTCNSSSVAFELRSNFTPYSKDFLMFGTLACSPQQWLYSCAKASFSMECRCTTTYSSAYCVLHLAAFHRLKRSCAYCNVSSSRVIPALSMSCSTFWVKCKPAVGAATDPFTLNKRFDRFRFIALFCLYLGRWYWQFAHSF